MNFSPQRSTSSAEPKPAALTARFTQGSIMHHVIVMSATAMVGLMAIFLVDALSLFYISNLNSIVKTAAVGFATQILFFALSVNIGMMIGTAAKVSKHIGQGRRKEARDMAASGIVLTTATSVLVSLALWFSRDNLLSFLNAEGEARVLALQFLAITLPANALFGLAIACSAVLRAVGDARGSMYVTLLGGIATAFIDPALIFGLHLDIMGAAWAVVAARFISAAVGLWFAVHKHHMVARPSWAALKVDFNPLLFVAFPAILTNLATPFGNVFVARILAGYGDGAIAGFAVIDRVTPLAFAGLFALTGAVGPILGQNWGAGLSGRMRIVYRDSFLLSGLYVLAIWAILVLARGLIVQSYHLQGLAADLTIWFCYISGLGWAGIGALFIANSIFNNLGAPIRATVFNWGRAVFGTIPAAYVGAAYDGPFGVLNGVFFAGIFIGAFAAYCAWRRLNEVATAMVPGQAQGQAV